MKFMNMSRYYGRVYRDEAGDDGDKGGGGDKLQAQVDDVQKQLSAVIANRDELLGEKKKEAAKRREAEELALQKANEKALASKDFEQLHKSSEVERQKLLKENEDLKTGIANEKRGLAARRIAGELAEGSNAELLAEFVIKRLKYSENELRVTNDRGELLVSSLDDLKKEFANDVRYSALLKGNQSSGGGATGGANGGGAAKSIKRDEFEALGPAERMKFVKSGGVVI